MNAHEQVPEPPKRKPQWGEPGYVPVERTEVEAVDVANAKGDGWRVFSAVLAFLAAMVFYTPVGGLLFLGTGFLGYRMAPTKGRLPWTGFHLGIWFGPFYLLWMLMTNRNT